MEEVPPPYFLGKYCKLLNFPNMIFIHLVSVAANVSKLSPTFSEISRNCYNLKSFNSECEYVLRSYAMLANTVKGLHSAHLQQITYFHLSMLLTNQIIALHSIKKVLLVEAV